MNIYRRLPADPAEWFSAEEVRKAKEYQRPLTVARMIDGGLSLALVGVVISTHAAPRLLDAVGVESWIVGLVVVLAALVAAETIVSLPVSIWTTFSHERKWGFSTETPKGFVGDALKGLAVGVVLLSALMIPLWTLIRTTELWWVYGWIVFLLFSVGLSFLAPIVLMPLFNRFEPLDDAELTADLQELARVAGLSISEVQVMDASKRTKKDNAFFAGLGRTRRVVLFDNILSQPARSIRAVVAHELGHWRRRHIVRSVALGVVTSFGLFALLRAVGTWDAALSWAGVDSLADPAALPLVLLTFVAAQTVLGLTSAWHSRALERQADLECLGITSDAEGFEEMMRGLSTRNLSELAPSRLAYLRLGHPPAAERLALARAWQASREPVASQAVVHQPTPDQPA